MMRSDEGLFQFESFALDLRRGCLLGPDGPVELRPRSFEVLCCLVAHAGQLVLKDEIIKSVWPNAMASDASLAQCVSEVRLALRDDEQRIIRTMARRGYLFAASVSRAARPDSEWGLSKRAMTVPAATESRTGTPCRMATPQELPVAAASDQTFRPAERRQLTLLACEWIGLAELSARLDPEDLRAVVAACHKRCAEVAERHQGAMARTLDDGALIYFGYPIGREHDAEHAVRAALDLLRTPTGSNGVGTRSQQGEAEGNAAARLDIRIGIASGVVVMDSESPTGMRPAAAVGAPPHLARRLLAAAPAGSLLIDHNTRQLVGGLFEYHRAEPVVRDSQSEPIPAFRVIGASRTESRFEALRGGGLTAMVGREDEMELLQRRWQRAQHGDGQVVLLCGEPGVGKSRLAAALVERASGTARQCLRYFCSPHHADSALHPILQQMERAAGLMPGDDAPARRRKLDAMLAHTAAPQDRSVLAGLLAGGVREGDPPRELPPQQRRGQTLDAIARHFEAQARRQPLIGLFEDIQWIDPSSLDVLGRMIDAVPRLPALLIATVRPGFVPPWVGAPHVLLLTLNRLTPRECRELIGRTAGRRRLADALIDEIAGRSDGVPLFLEELIKAALAAQSRAEALEPAAIPAPEAMQLPASLQSSLVARLDRLGEAREVARIGAAIGRRFSYELVAAVADRSEAELSEQFERLSGAGLVLQEGCPPHATFMFRHALIQDAAYGTLLRDARRRLHARIAHALANDLPQLGASEPESLARHYFEAGLFPQAIASWREAGDLALRHAAFDEAIAHLGKAITLADRTAQDGAPALSGSARLQLQIAHGQALLWAGDTQQTIAAFARARELAAMLDHPSERFSAYYGLWAGSIMRAELDAAGDIAETFLNDARSHSESLDLAAAHRTAGTTFWHRADFANARAHLEQVRVIHQRRGDGDAAFRFGPDPGAAATALLASALWVTGELDRGRRLLEQATTQAVGTGHVPTLAYVHTYTLIIEMMRGDAERASARAQLLAGLCREHGLRHLDYAEICRARAHWRPSEREDGLIAMRDAVARLRERGPSLGLPWCLSLLAEVETRAAKTDAGLATVGAALAEAQRTGEHWYTAESHRLHGELLLARHPADIAGAEQAFCAALTVARQQKARSFALRAALSLAKLHAASGRKADAHRLLAPALAGFTPSPELPEIADAQALLARVAASRSATAGLDITPDQPSVRTVAMPPPRRGETL